MTSPYSVYLIKRSRGVQLGRVDSLAEKGKAGEEQESHTHAHMHNAELSRSMIQPLRLCV